MTDEETQTGGKEKMEDSSSASADKQEVDVTRTEENHRTTVYTVYIDRISATDSKSPGSDPHPCREKEEEEEEEAVESLFTQRLHIISVCSTEPGSSGVKKH